MYGRLRTEKREKGKKRKREKKRKQQPQKIEQKKKKKQHSITHINRISLRNTTLPAGSSSASGQDHKMVIVDVILTHWYLTQGPSLPIRNAAPFVISKVADKSKF